MSEEKRVEVERGTLSPGEPHPAALEARDYIATFPLEELFKWREAFASCAIEGNRLGEVCNTTINRLLKGETVSDRYLLGLAWAMAHADLMKLREKENDE